MSNQVSSVSAPATVQFGVSFPIVVTHDAGSSKSIALAASSDCDIAPTSHAADPGTQTTITVTLTDLRSPSVTRFVDIEAAMDNKANTFTEASP